MDGRPADEATIDGGGALQHRSDKGSTPRWAALCLELLAAAQQTP